MADSNPDHSDPKSAAQKSSDGPSNAQKDPDDWLTGDEKMTGAQASYLKTLCEEVGEEFQSNLSKADASKRIDALKAKSKRLKNNKS